MRVDQSRYGYIYRTTNLVNGKTYVGKHQIGRAEHWLDYLGSGTAITRAVRKYGRDSFKKELLAYADTLEELNDLESKLINKEVLANSAGVYNILITPSSRLMNRLNDADVLGLYFDKLMSMTEIADFMGVSQPAIHAYLQKFRDSDPRFKKVTQGRALGVSKNKGLAQSEKQKAMNSARMLKLPKIPCPKCEDQITSGGAFATHLTKCNGVPFPRCEICNSSLSRRNAKRCADHKYTKVPK